MTTHYMDEAEWCDRIAIMDHGEIVALDTPEALKAGVGKDRVTIVTDDDRAAIDALAQQFGVEAGPREGAVVFGVENGAEFVPRLFAELELPIRSVAVSRPTLDDVFMSYTGTTIRDAEEDAGKSRNRTRRQMMRRRRYDRDHDPRPAYRRHPRRPRRPRQRPGALVPFGAAGDQDRLEARADPLLLRPTADRHRARAAAAVPVRARRGPAAAVVRQHLRGRLQDDHLPRHPVRSRCCSRRCSRPPRSSGTASTGSCAK